MSALTRARNELGLSIEEAARELGIPAGYLSEIENGKRGVSSERADQIARLVKKKKEEIFLPTRYAIRKDFENNTA